ncbi:hypothetical protein OEZ86_002487 [Tetradesmus obliquus]|uniref:Uncharacterized protein n=1 Tax=Tetradesmus obliquus TaxID=3088 RepID=A0A383VKU4_TETOB|nr:hypothetical protein OEZ86_002487 [Tetradesmus obliquus]|eukprot:jgi/Sobl393_1/10795/SZX64996.1
MQLARHCQRLLPTAQCLSVIGLKPSAAASITTGRGKPEGYQPVDDKEALKDDPRFKATPENEGTADPATTAHSRPTAAAQRQQQQEVQGDSRPGGPADASADTAGIMPETPGLPQSGAHIPFTGTNREPWEEQKKSGKDTKV